MIRKSILWLLGIGLSLNAYSTDDERYTYILDLTKVENDQLVVTLITPNISEREINFYMPKIIPGTYRIADYGRFVSDLKAFDKKGKELKVQRIDDNTWKISKANKLVKVTYKVDDIFDTEIKENMVYPMAGTNIDAGKNFVINTSGFFGYFEGIKDIPVDMKIIRPASFYGSTGLIPEINPDLSASMEKELINYINDQQIVDHFTTDNYNHLIDSPLMYCEPDTTVIDVAGTEVLVSVYSPSGQVTAEYVAENIKEILFAQRDYLGGDLPVDKYAFIFYCEDMSKLLPIQGALEHSYSSFYYFPDFDQTHLLGGIRDAAAHEFFHIITPLNIHSEEIQYFDFNDPKMSEHLWLYEGMTEYAAGHVQVKYDIISYEGYFEMLRNKMTSASNNYNDTLSFTIMSKEILDTYHSEFANVYSKGALIGMCIDIMLRDLTDGEYGTQDLMNDLSKEYGIDQPFKDEELFDKIISLTYPEIGKFFNDYVQNGAVLPYMDIFEIVGVDYTAEIAIQEYSLGELGIGLDPETNKLFVNSTARMNDFGKAMGYEDGDIFLKINDVPLPENLGELQAFFENAREEMKEGEMFSVTVWRKNDEGEKEEVALQTEIFKVETFDQHLISLKEDATDRQLMIRKAWLEPK